MSTLKKIFKSSIKRTGSIIPSPNPSPKKQTKSIGKVLKSGRKGPTGKSLLS